MGRVVDEVVAALQAGKPVILPMDTVYGLCASPYREQHVRKLYELKGRDPLQPMALVAGDLEMLFECVPELRGRSGTVARAILPGPYTLVLPNPARRFPWLAGAHKGTIGIRVPALDGPGKTVLERVGALAATSANLHGLSDPGRVEDVPEEIRAHAAVIDGGALPGTPSTVVDLTGTEPRILREGAVPTDEALARLEAALAVRAGE
jgi:L-threonylcarbamoyladenylate synthase